MINLSPEKPIVRQKLGDQVFEKIRQQIESGELKPGDDLQPERELMKQYGVGRPAVREALQLLHSKGLIIVSHGERSKVAKLKASDAFRQIDDVAKLLLAQEPSSLANLKQFRRLFEIGFVELAAENCQAADVYALNAIVDKQQENLGSAEAFIRSDIEFHARIAEISGNELFKAVSESVLSWIFEHHSSLLHWSGKEETTLREHKKIIASLAKNDKQGAVKIMTAHLDRSEPLLKS